MRANWEKMNIFAVISLFLILILILTTLRCTAQEQQQEKLILQYNIMVNNPPNKPSRPVGPTSGEIKVYYRYTSCATDPDGDRIHYLFDWGDGWSCETKLYESGENCTACHC